MHTVNGRPSRLKHKVIHVFTNALPRFPTQRIENGRILKEIGSKFSAYKTGKKGGGGDERRVFGLRPAQAVHPPVSIQKGEGPRTGAEQAHG
jgi:hypothetical protein